jgi:hypothetical protein
MEQHDWAANKRGEHYVVDLFRRRSYVRISILAGQIISTVIMPGRGTDL